jgi:hypothetical protein
VEQIVVKGHLETRHATLVLTDETTGETLYVLSDPRDLLTQRTGDLVQVHGTVAETEREVPLLEVTRLD